MVKRVENLNKAIEKSVLAFKAPENLTVDEWADKYRILSPEASAESGNWRTSRTPYLKEPMRAFTDPKVSRIVMVASSQVGKALDIDTPIPTSTGYKHMKNVQVGDIVYDEKGHECHVIAVSPIQENKKCYEVCISDGSKIVACNEHKWAVVINGEYQVLKTEEIDISVINLLPEPTGRYIKSVVEVESRPVKCISVDSPNHLYLASFGLVPTHNSEIELNMIGYIIDQDPSSILYIQPTLDDAKKFSKLRIAPMIRDCKCLSSKVADVKSRDSTNTILQKSFAGGMLTITGSNAPSALASTPVRYVIGDERDRWAVSAGSEGDPWALAEARQTTFYNRKAVEVSTPTIKGASNIEKSFYLGTQERWCHQCPNCKEYHNIVFNDIHFKYDTIANKNGKKQYKINQVEYVCPECGCFSSEEVMRKQPAKWIAENPVAYENGIRSFWLNAFSSPWQSWSKVCRSFLEAKDDPERLKVVYNTMFGELWEDRGELPEGDIILEKCEEYEAELPHGVLCLTCGVDTQDNRLEYEVVGHGYYGEKWGIKRGVILGRPDDNEVWQMLDDVIDHVYKFKNGRGLKVSITCVDSGGHFTQNVYEQCKKRELKRVFAIKGKGGEGIPFTSPPKQTKIMLDGHYQGLCWLYSIGVDSGKTAIMNSLKVQEAGAKYYHFPKNDEYNIDFFNSLLSEKLVLQGKKWSWVKLSGHTRNEALDCRNYANAAFAILNPNLEAIEKRLNDIEEEKAEEIKQIRPQRRRKRNLITTDF